MLNIYNTDDDMEVFMCSKLKPNLFLQWLDHDMSNKSAWFSLSRAFYSKRTIDRVHKLQISQIDISTKITLYEV